MMPMMEKVEFGLRVGRVSCRWKQCNGTAEGFGLHGSVPLMPFSYTTSAPESLLLHPGTFDFLHRDSLPYLFFHSPAP